MRAQSKKISTKIWRPVINKLEKIMEATCLRRDAYISKVMEIELDRLDEEVDIQNTTEAQTFVASSLEHLDRKLVSITLGGELNERLSDICTRKRIVRDAFFNRLLLLLSASPKTIDYLLFAVHDNWKKAVKSDSACFRSTFYPLPQSGIDPFCFIREGLAEVYKDAPEPNAIILSEPIIPSHRPYSLYNFPIINKNINGVNLAGLSCFVREWDVPGTSSRKSLEDIWADF